MLAYLFCCDCGGVYFKFCDVRMYKIVDVTNEGLEWTGCNLFL